MSTRNPKSQEVQSDNPNANAVVTYETPWKLLAAFAVLFVACVVYGFVS